MKRINKLWELELLILLKMNYRDLEISLNLAKFYCILKVKKLGLKNTLGRLNLKKLRNLFKNRFQQ